MLSLILVLAALMESMIFALSIFGGIVSEVFLQDIISHKTGNRKNIFIG